MGVAAGHAGCGQHVVAQIQPVVTKLGREAELRDELVARTGCDVEPGVGTTLRVDHGFGEAAPHIKGHFAPVLRRGHPCESRQTKRYVKKPMLVHWKLFPS